MAKEKKKSAKKSSDIFHNIMKASVNVDKKEPMVKIFYGEYEHLSIGYTTNFDGQGKTKSYKVIPFIDGEKRDGFVLRNEDVPPEKSEREIEEFLYRQAHSRNWIENPKKREFQID